MFLFEIDSPKIFIQLAETLVNKGFGDTDRIKVFAK